MPSPQPSLQSFWVGVKGALADAGTDIQKLAQTGAKATEKRYREEQIASIKSEWGRKAFDLFMAGDLEGVREHADAAEAKIAPLRDQIASLTEDISQVRWGERSRGSVDRDIVATPPAEVGVVVVPASVVEPSIPPPAAVAPPAAVPPPAAGTAEVKEQAAADDTEANSTDHKTATDVESASPADGASTEAATVDEESSIQADARDGL